MPSFVMSRNSPASSSLHRRSSPPRAPSCAGSTTSKRSSAAPSLAAASPKPRAATSRGGPHSRWSGMESGSFHLTAPPFTFTPMRAARRASEATSSLAGLRFAVRIATEHTTFRSRRCWLWSTPSSAGVNGSPAFMLSSTSTTKPYTTALPTSRSGPRPPWSSSANSSLLHAGSISLFLLFGYHLKRTRSLTLLPAFPSHACSNLPRTLTCSRPRSSSGLVVRAVPHVAQDRLILPLAWARVVHPPDVLHRTTVLYQLHPASQPLQSRWCRPPRNTTRHHVLGRQPRRQSATQNH